jgi:uncharacterized protein
VGDPEVLTDLERIAPVHGVRGNVDRPGACGDLPATQVVEAGSVLIYVVHIIEDLDLDPEAAGIGVVVSGHSHRPSVERRNGVLFINPGSAGPRRFDLPVTVGRLRIEGGSIVPEIVHLMP